MFVTQRQLFVSCHRQLSDCQTQSDTIRKVAGVSPGDLNCRILYSIAHRSIVLFEIFLSINVMKSSCNDVVRRKVINKKNVKLFSQQPLHDVEFHESKLSKAKDPLGQRSS